MVLSQNFVEIKEIKWGSHKAGPLQSHPGLVFFQLAKNSWWPEGPEHICGCRSFRDPKSLWITNHTCAHFSFFWQVKKVVSSAALKPAVANLHPNERDLGGHGRNPLRNCYILQRAVQKWRVFRGVLNLRDVILGGWWLHGDKNGWSDDEWNEWPFLEDARAAARIQFWKVGEFQTALRWGLGKAGVILGIYSFFLGGGRGVVWNGKIFRGWFSQIFSDFHLFIRLHRIS